MPRNVHKSVINALILSGGIPIFVAPDVDQDTGIANGVPTENYVKAMDENPDTKAIFVAKSTYFFITSDLKAICEEAHKRGIIVIVDEAHGAHLHLMTACLYLLWKQVLILVLYLYIKLVVLLLSQV